jgi:SAM-dependent methyltransferase
VSDTTDNREVEGLDAELQAVGWPSRWERFRLPVELAGRSFLDVGCWEGVHCAEAVRRGASETVGVDICTGRELRQNVERYGFDFLQIDVFGESFLGLGRFDVVLCSGLFPTAQSPAHLLTRLHAVTKELLVLETPVTTLGGEEPVLHFVGGDEGTPNRSHWWIPNAACVERMLAAAGFGGIALVWENVEGDSGRACFHAVPSGAPDRRSLQARRPKEMSIAGGSRTKGRGRGADGEAAASES